MCFPSCKRTLAAGPARAEGRGNPVTGLGSPPTRTCGPLAVRIRRKARLLPRGGRGPTMDGKAELDPQETQEWLDALDGVLVREGPERAHFLIEQLIER